MLSNHYHLLLQTTNAEDLARFMNLFNSKIAREVGRLTGWRDKVWSRRYQAIPVSQEEAAQVARLIYVLSHGCKEGLVERVADWPGAHAGPALQSGRTLEGTWLNRTRYHRARLRGEKMPLEHFAEPETLKLVQLPCWAHLATDTYRELVCRLIEKIEAEAAQARNRSGRRALGPEAILRQDPKSEPEEIKASPAPRFHALRRWVRRELQQTYAEFVKAFREAAERLRSGDLDAKFPLGSFPPRLPFVRALVPT